MPGKKIEISDDCLMKQLKLKSYRAFEVVFNVIMRDYIVLLWLI